MIKFFYIIIISVFAILTKSAALENKIILKIDNDIVTTIDILNEINNLKFFNKDLNQISDQEIFQIAIQSITKNKIKKNEILKKFKNMNLENEDYLNLLIENKYKSLGFKDLKSFEEQLVKNKIDFKEFREKLIVDIFWGQIIYLKYNDKIVINENELREQLQNKKKYLSFNLKEIVFQVEDGNEIVSKYNLIKNDIKKIGFEAAAIKHSISNSAINGGDLGWVNERVINEQLINELNQISLKSITEPIRISSGFLILQKFNQKQIEEDIDVEVELKKLIDYEKNQQFNSYSNIYYNKVRKNLNINAP